MPCSTPVVFLIYRRPDLTAQVFEAIRQAQPTKLLVVADGPRNEEESVLCQQAREVTEQVDWDCEVFRNYSDVNLGCRKRVSSGITWAFEQVEEAIILEDDCLPHLDFFLYCTTLLDRYRYDERVWCITGDNAAKIPLASDLYSYGFIKYPLIWGWATWRRCWNNYLHDFDHIEEIAAEESYRESLYGKNSSLSDIRFSYWKSIMQGKGPDSWAASWAFTCMTNSGLTLLPSVNLVSNIGFGKEATHTFGSGSQRSTAEVMPILPLRHPPFMIRDSHAERTFEKTIYGQLNTRRFSLRLTVLRLKTKARKVFLIR